MSQKSNGMISMMRMKWFVDIEFNLTSVAGSGTDWLKLGAQWHFKQIWGTFKSLQQDSISKFKLTINLLNSSTSLLQSWLPNVNHSSSTNLYDKTCKPIHCKKCLWKIWILTFYIWGARQLVITFIWEEKENKYQPKMLLPNCTNVNTYIGMFIITSPW